MDFIGPAWFEQKLVFYLSAFRPGFVTVGKVDALARRRMAGPPKFIHRTGTGNAQIFDLQLHLGCGGGVIITGNLQSKPVGFVFLVPRKREDAGTQREMANAEEEENQRPGSDIRNAVETELFLEATDQGRVHVKENISAPRT